MRIANMIESVMHLPSRRLSRIVLGALLLLLWACQPLPRPQVAVLPAYEALFMQSRGWIGADAVYSVALDSDRTLWLFGDTFIGKVEDGRRLNTTIVNNSVAVQAGRSPYDAEVSFHAGRREDGSAAAFIRPADGRGWIWIYDGIRTGGGLYLFLVQIERSGARSVFDFRVTGNWLGRVHNPDDPPERWRIDQRRLPWGPAPGRGAMVFGSALLAVGGDLYVYGVRDRIIAGRQLKNMLVAKVPLGKIEEFDSWRFFADGRWATEAGAASAVCEDVANEYSVSYLPRLGKYVLVYSQSGLSPNILARLAPGPTGPWSSPLRLYRCPEAGWDPRVFCYAGKGHPELSELPGELIVTYVSNATELELLEADARLYRPRFLRVTFE